MYYVYTCEGKRAAQTCWKTLLAPRSGIDSDKSIVIPRPPSDGLLSNPLSSASLLKLLTIRSYTHTCARACRSLARISRRVVYWNRCWVYSSCLIARPVAANVALYRRRCCGCRRTFLCRRRSLVSRRPFCGALAVVWRQSAAPRRLPMPAELAVRSDPSASHPFAGIRPSVWHVLDARPGVETVLPELLL
jgi:hypothetical protein